MPALGFGCETYLRGFKLFVCFIEVFWVRLGPIKVDLGVERRYDWVVWPVW